MSLKAYVSKNGNLNIPHCNRDCIEFTVEPKNFTTIKIMGFY